MINKSLVFVMLIMLAVSCKQENLEEDYSNSGALAFNLVKICVEKTLNTHAEFNTPAYVLDLSSVSTLDQRGVDSFYKIKNPGFPSNYDDSVVASQTRNLSKTEILKYIIVRINEVDYIDKKYVYVTLSKIRSGNQVIKVGLDLKRDGDSYKIIKSEFRR